MTKKCKRKNIFYPIQYEKLLRCHGTKKIQVGRYTIWVSNISSYKDCLNEVDIFFALDRSYSVSISNVYFKLIQDGEFDFFIANSIYKTIIGGKKVGFGCVGGHGRTGWLLAYLICRIEGLQGSELVYEVRKRLCKEAIESFYQATSLGMSSKKWVKEKGYPAQKFNMNDWFKQENTDEMEVYQTPMENKKQTWNIPESVKNSYFPCYTDWGIMYLTLQEHLDYTHTKNIPKRYRATKEVYGNSNLFKE